MNCPNGAERGMATIARVTMSVDNHKNGERRPIEVLIWSDRLATNGTQNIARMGLKIHA